ncbi:hypothetical protein MOUN0_H02190 [Monosporozyma unispora]
MTVKSRNFRICSKLLNISVNILTYTHTFNCLQQKKYKKYYSGNLFASSLDNIYCYICQYFTPDEGHCEFSSQVPINQTSKQLNDFFRNNL